MITFYTPHGFCTSPIVKRHLRVLGRAPRLPRVGELSAKLTEEGPAWPQPRPRLPLSKGKLSPAGD